MGCEMEKRNISDPYIYALCHWLPAVGLQNFNTSTHRTCQELHLEDVFPVSELLRECGEYK